MVHVLMVKGERVNGKTRVFVWIDQCRVPSNKVDSTGADGLSGKGIVQQ